MFYSITYDNYFSNKTNLSFNRLSNVVKAIIPHSVSFMAYMQKMPFQYFKTEESRSVTLWVNRIYFETPRRLELSWTAIGQGEA